MSKIISYKGKLDIGTQDRIKLSTITGKTGYRIKKFEIINKNIGVQEVELVAKIYLKDQTGLETATIDFSEGDLLATAYFEYNSGSSVITSPYQVIFDNKTFNQDIFIYCLDASGATDPCNYYIELEAMPINDLEATMLTLKSIKTVKA
jgi:hypothetical protein